VASSGDPRDPGWAPFGMPPPRHETRRRIALLVAIVLVAAGAGWGALTLHDHLTRNDAHVDALSTDATQLSVPSVTYTAGAVPRTPAQRTTPPLSTSSTTTAAPPPAPAPPPARTTAPPKPAAWVLVTDTAAHARAEFPVRPREKDTTITFKGVKLVRHDAIAQVSATYTQVSSMDLPVNVAPSQAAGVLQGLDAGLTKDAGRKTTSDVATTFRGRTARQVVIPAIGGSVTMLLVMWDENHLTTSFAAL
jgi:hypothetical protein